MRHLKMLLIALLLGSSAAAQSYISFGIGFAGSSNSSEELEAFRESYNWVNGLGLTAPFDGFQLALGLRPGISFRYWDKWNVATSAGYFKLVEKDFANFSDGAARQLELITTSAFADLEFGRTFGSFFLNGLASIYPARSSRLESNYLRPPEADDSIELSGSYKAARSWSADLGLHVGYFKAPLILSARISFPVATNGGEYMLSDNNSEKNSQGISEFPSDYVNFVQGNSYEAISSDIDGFKIVFEMGYALEIFNRK